MLIETFHHNSTAPLCSLVWIIRFFKLSSVFQRKILPHANCSWHLRVQKMKALIRSKNAKILWLIFLFCTQLVFKWQNLVLGQLYFSIDNFCLVKSHLVYSVNKSYTTKALSFIFNLSVIRYYLYQSRAFKQVLYSS